MVDRNYLPGVCACGFTTSIDPRSAEWHRQHRAHHLSVYPQLDATSVAGLDQLVETYERKEQLS